MSTKSREGDRFHFIRNTRIFFSSDAQETTEKRRSSVLAQSVDACETGDVTQQNRMAKHLHFLLSGTTMHGLRQASDSGAHASRRTVWSVVIVGMLLCYATGTFYSITKYLRFESRTRLSTVTAEKLAFPAVTICPQNQVSRSSLARDADLKHWITRIESRGIAKLSNEDVQEAQKVLSKHLLVDIFETQLDDVILHCRFATFEVACSDVFRPILTEKSVCFTFMDDELVARRGVVESELPGSPFGRHEWTALMAYWSHSKHNKLFLLQRSGSTTVSTTTPLASPTESAFASPSTTRRHTRAKWSTRWQCRPEPTPTSALRKK